MLLDGQVTVANRTAAHIIVSLWRGGLLTFGATERPLYLAPKRPGELFKRGFKEGGRGDKIKILSGKYCIRAEPYTEEMLDNIKATRAKVGLTLKHRPEDLEQSIKSSPLSSLYRTSVEEVVASVEAASLCSGKQSLGEQLWDSLQNGLLPLQYLPLTELTRSILEWVFHLYSAADQQKFLEAEGKESWRKLVHASEFDGMAVMDFTSAVTALLPQVQQASTLAGILLSIATDIRSKLNVVEEQTYQLQLQEWQGNFHLSTVAKPDCETSGNEYAVVGGPSKSLHLADWKMHLVEVGDVDPYNPI